MIKECKITKSRICGIFNKMDKCKKNISHSFLLGSPYVYALVICNNAPPPPTQHQGIGVTLTFVQNVKEAAYKGMVRPILEYGSSVWDPHPDKLKKELEKVQNRAARFVTRNYDYETGSMTGILGQLKWESLKKRRKDNRLILLYKGLKGKAKIPTDDLIPKTRHGRNQHSLAFQIPSASKDVYMYSFFPQTIRDWNDLPESLISSSELSDDSVSKFTSLVRARD